MLQKWSTNYEEFSALKINPKIKPLLPLSLNLSRASELLLKRL